MSEILLNCWEGKGWRAEPDTEVTITFSKLFHGASCIFRLILWLAHNRFLQTVISEENNWTKLHVLKIATFKCRRLNLTNFGKTLNDKLTVNVKLCIFDLISQFLQVMKKPPCLWRSHPNQWNILLLLPVRKELHWQNWRGFSWCLHLLLCLWICCLHLRIFVFLPVHFHLPALCLFGGLGYKESKTMMKLIA